MIKKLMVIALVVLAITYGAGNTRSTLRTSVTYSNNRCIISMDNNTDIDIMLDGLEYCLRRHYGY